MSAANLVCGLQVDPLAPHPSGQELLEMYRVLQATEKDVLQASITCCLQGRITSPCLFLSALQRPGQLVA